MKISQSIILAVSITILITTGCSGGKPDARKEAASTSNEIKSSPVVGNETSLFLKDLEAAGDYVNSQQYPSLIKAALVNDPKGAKILVVDLRSKEDFAAGHIKGAVNKKFEELPSWLETGIKPFSFDKIVIVCNDGQLSSYTTSLLRLKGYGNVFAMRWGMSGWNMKFAEKNWLSGLSGKYESSLDTVTHSKPPAGAMPELKTGFSSAREISDARFSKVFSEGTGNVFITSDEVFSDPAKYYIINLERKDKYNDGHIPGAVRYKPDATLGVVEEMASIPAGKTVVLYCGTGHNSAFATAYLRLFGYDARTLKYGNNSFMHGRMEQKKEALSWLPFSEAEVNDFPFVK